MEKEKLKEKKETREIKEIAVIRIKGEIGIKKDIKDTLRMLRLYKKNSCVILNENPSVRGMVVKIKDFVTWGEVDNEAVKLLEEKFGKKKFYRLNPPKGGYGRKGTKVPFKIGGALGYRGDNINTLIKRML